jgi:FAD/FMN-containing dehydrogenase/Fe-S oxidoreductase
MKIDHQKEIFFQLKNILEGDLNWDESTLIQYATDASAYREIPSAVALPKCKDDLVALINFAKQHKIPLIPRAAGTSLAGQVVGKGIIVDISRYWGKIIEINKDERWVTVEPGVILDELNLALKPYGLFFGPETSTSNRCMIAGMVGNNSCGSHSILYGSTRDHTISVKMILDDGIEYEFGPLSNIEFEKKIQLEGKEGDIYRFISTKLSDNDIKHEIVSQYPEPSIKRRNTGYAIDMLIDNSIFGKSATPFNFSKLIAGSEGTLGFITEIKLNLVPLPPKEKAVIAVHLLERNHAFKANLIALKYKPGAVEMMDNIILNCTKGNIDQQKNRFFIEGDPGAILIVEFARETKGEITLIASEVEAEMRSAGYGYHFPIIWGDDVSRVWALRKAGLGVLSNMEGDAKPVSIVEDTAIAVEKLPDYMKEFASIMASHNLDCVYHAHIGSGELHLRPVLNLKDPKDVELFRIIAFEVAHLVKKYRGSLSGEHGDGRLRGELIPIMLGERVYKLMQEIKQIFDSENIFNPGKIVNTPPLNSFLRYEPGRDEKELSTIFDFSKVQGLLRAVEKCNGSGDCRKTVLAGGTMCPSYMASSHEGNTTRARANILREFLTHSDKKNPFNHREIYQALDLCLSCKGCKNECPSSVDMAKLKAEFLQHWYDANGIPLRSRMVAYITKINAFGSIIPSITNFFLSNRIIAPILMKILGFEPKRNMPLLSDITLKKWSKNNRKSNNDSSKRVLLFPDEFTNYNDSHIGIKAIELLETLGYEVIIPDISESGRTYISKGLLRTAKKITNKNIEKLSALVSDDCPLIGIEPSAILSFRDEYLDLSTSENLCYASYLSRRSLQFEEFFMGEVQKGNIKKESFKSVNREMILHGHCQQKAVASTNSTKAMLSFPEGHTITEIPSGCCGMAGSFGYEKEHYELSMKVGELVLFPEIRKTNENITIVASGTSCRHQIKDGTGRTSYHPIEIMWDAVIKK